MRLCTVEGCGRRHHGNGLCDKHRMRLHRHGDINAFSIYDLNEITVDGDIVRMSLYDKDGEKIGETKIDKVDLPLIEGKRWGVIGNGYVIRYEGQKNIHLHRLIANTPPGFDTDHINGDIFDNRRCNLRVTTHANNCCNQRPREGFSSRYKGIWWEKRRNHWVAEIMKHDKKVHIGSFKTQEEAALAYNIVAQKLHGEFARLNEVTI